ncbi:LOG family protein [Pseudomonas sp. KNUC1026]|uniref:LOG family protein n=1 Tax=Pseudomonas sp. KNUC1026 TaxID=2893890 RepID=UPI001F273A04|nr:LOG family protein [Pseudomonas sp. KNUC1026]UFH50338.1 LOG family protein [Pseudomonas sp. KNUC1026]
MPYKADPRLAEHFLAQGLEMAEQVDAQLQQVAPTSPNLALYRDMLLTVLRMAQDDHNRWNAKITLQTLRELDHAFRTLERFRPRRKVTVFGSARTVPDHALYLQARELGSALAAADLMVITGAGGGIMAAAHEGAGPAHSLGFNIALPFEQHANATLAGSEQLLPFHFFFIRKLFFVKEADALVLCPGGFGTLDEALEVLTLVQTGKSPLVPILLLDEPGGTYWEGLEAFIRNELEAKRYILPTDLRLIRRVTDPQSAVEEIERFYANYHSSRWLNRLFILRLRHGLNAVALAGLGEHFGDLLTSGTFEQHDLANSPTPDEPELSHLVRLSFHFTGRAYGRLRELVDFVNHPEHWA